MSEKTGSSVKICCIADVAEAQLAMRYGANIIGLVGPMPSGPGVITDEQIAHIAAEVSGQVETFLLTSETTSDAIIRHHLRTGTSTIQFTDHVPIPDLQQIRKALPGLRLVQVIHVQDESVIEVAVELQSLVDAFLLDSGNPGGAVKTLGGTGRTHNWEISRQLVETVDIPVYLAGGLRPENVAEAIRKVRPFGLDLCSGVRTNGSLDEQKLSAFMAAVKSGD